jgi:hypothetical protein
MGGRARAPAAGPKERGLAARRRLERYDLRSVGVALHQHRLRIGVKHLILLLSGEGSALLDEREMCSNDRRVSGSSNALAHARRRVMACEPGVSG